MRAAEGLVSTSAIFGMAVFRGTIYDLQEEDWQRAFSGWSWIDCHFYAQ